MNSQKDPAKEVQKIFDIISGLECLERELTNNVRQVRTLYRKSDNAAGLEALNTTINHTYKRIGRKGYLLTSDTKTHGAALEALNFDLSSIKQSIKEGFKHLIEKIVELAKRFFDMLRLIAEKIMTYFKKDITKDMNADTLKGINIPIHASIRPLYKTYLALKKQKLVSSNYTLDDNTISFNIINDVLTYYVTYINAFINNPPLSLTLMSKLSQDQNKIIQSIIGLVEQKGDDKGSMHDVGPGIIELLKKQYTSGSAWDNTRKFYSPQGHKMVECVLMEFYQSASNVTQSNVKLEDIHIDGGDEENIYLSITNGTEIKQFQRLARDLSKVEKSIPLKKFENADFNKFIDALVTGLTEHDFGILKISGESYARKINKQILLIMATELSFSMHLANAIMTISNSSMACSAILVEQMLKDVQNSRE